MDHILGEEKPVMEDLQVPENGSGSDTMDSPNLSPESCERSKVFDLTSWEQTVQNTLPSLLRLAVRFCGDPYLAEDCVQQSLLKATKYFHRFSGTSKIETWLHQIVINECRDQLRKRTRNKETEQLQEDHGNQNAQESPDSKLSHEEQKLRIRKFVEKLPERQREVLILSLWEKRSAQEVANLLDTNIASVYSNLSMARKKIRQWLESSESPS